MTLSQYLPTISFAVAGMVLALLAAPLLEGVVHVEIMIRGLLHHDIHHKSSDLPNKRSISERFTGYAHLSHKSRAPVFML